MNAGAIHPAASGSRGPWRLALDRAGVIEELGLPSADMPGPGLARCVFDTLGAHLSVGGKSARRAAAGVPGEDQGSAEGHRGRMEFVARRPAKRSRATPVVAAFPLDFAGGGVFVMSSRRRPRPGRRCVLMVLE